jgi:hypothetical protein
VSPTEAFEPDATNAAHVRRFVAGTLAAWDVDGHEVCVVANEVATNAILHGRTRFSVRLDDLGDRCRVEIADRNPRMPVLGASSGQATSGHGLGLVDALCTRWGVEARDDGKAVWCEVPLGVGRSTDRLRHLRADTPSTAEMHGVR